MVKPWSPTAKSHHCPPHSSSCSGQGRLQSLLLLPCKCSCDKRSRGWGTTAASSMEPWVPLGGGGSCWSKALASFACECPAFLEGLGGKGREEESLFRAQDHTGSIFNFFVFNHSIYFDLRDVSAPFFQKGELYPLFPVLCLFFLFLIIFKLPAPTWRQRGATFSINRKVIEKVSHWRSQSLLQKPWKVDKPVN